MKFNVLLVIVDCLRYDRVTPQYMPFLHEFAKQNTWFSNYWSTSHNTDASITPLLTGKWPDELRLWTMMFEDKAYSIPEDIEMLPQTARKHGYSTAMISNLGRWYQRGVELYKDCTDWHGSETFRQAGDLVKFLHDPWLLVVHDHSCHTNYRGGSYDQACREVDVDLCHLLTQVTEDERLRDNTFVFIASDHGEGLGEHGIQQHGHGLWPVLTHVPLIVKYPKEEMMSPYSIESINDAIYQHVDTYFYMLDVISGPPHIPAVHPRMYVHLVGRTKDTWHRAVTNGSIMVIKEQDANTGKRQWMIANCHDGTYETINFDDMVNYEKELWQAAREHAARFDIDADTGEYDDAILEDRLRRLGYFE